MNTTTPGNRVLATTSRLPCATEEIRKLGRCGYEVHATDTFHAAPGNHSHWVAASHVVPSPRLSTAAFLARIAELATEHEIERLIPMFEEVFFLQRYAAALPAHLRVFAPPFEVLHRLHDKAAFVGLAQELAIPVPRTRVAENRRALRDAVADLPRYFARPVYSRGGIFLCTNVGPLAGVIPVDECTPTTVNPWLVQEFVDGRDVCTFSVARQGRVRAHATYVHPKTIDSAGGIVLESIVDDEALDDVCRVVEATAYDGQISFDFLRTERGLVAVECNPRPTAGVAVMPDAMLIDALFGAPEGPTHIARAGTRRHIWSALLRDMVLHWTEIPSDLREIFSGAEDLYAGHGDPWPGLWQFLSLSHVMKYRSQRSTAEATRSDLMAGYFHDVTWDGDDTILGPRVAAFAGALESRHGLPDRSPGMG